MTDPQHCSPVTANSFVPWLRELAEKGGKGVVNNIDARCLGRIADELERLHRHAQQPASPVNDICSVSAMVALVEHGIEPDVQELLVRGEPSRGIAPGALKKAIEAALARHAQSTLERIPHDDNTRLATIAECAKVADDHSRSNKTAANNMFEAGGQKSAILFMESARTCDEIAAKLRALSVTSTEGEKPAGGHCWCGLHVSCRDQCDRCNARGAFASTERVGSLFPDIGEQEPETIQDDDAQLSSTDGDSPVLGAAKRAAKVVEGWSEAKRDYADRVTSPLCSCKASARDGQHMAWCPAVTRPDGDTP